MKKLFLTMLVVSGSLGADYQAPQYSSVLAPDIEVFLGMGTQGTAAQQALFSECQKSKPGQCMATVVGPRGGKMSVNNLACYRDCISQAKNDKAGLKRIEKKLAKEYNEAMQMIKKQAQQLKGGVRNPVYKACSQNCGQKPSGFCLHNCISLAKTAAAQSTK